MGPSMISSENGLLRESVLMKVRGRDVGRFVDERRGARSGNAARILHWARRMTATETAFKKELLDQVFGG